MARALGGLRGSVAEAREKNRQAALKKLENEFLPPLLEIQERPPAPWQHRILWTLVFLLVAAILWSYFGKLNIVATASGQFVPDGRVKMVQPITTATVEHIYVHNGEQVRKGQLLVSLNPTVTQATLHATRQELALRDIERARIQAQLSGHNSLTTTAKINPEYLQMENALQAAQEAEYRSHQSAEQSRLAQNQTALEAAKSQGASLQQQEDLLHPQVVADAALAKIGAIPEIQYMEAQQKEISLRGQITQNKGDIARYTQRQTELEQDISETRANYHATLLHSLGENTQSVISLEAQQTHANRELALHALRSPVNGVVQSVEVRNIGEVVTPAQSVVSIVPSGTPLVVECALPDSHMAFVHVGQKARVKVAAYPFEQYGALQGVVDKISPDAISQHGSDGSSGALFYRIRVTVAHPSLMVHGKAVKMRPGMSVSVNINTGERRILQFFLSPLFRDWDEGLSVR
ncbi:HlyD family type I secretion periplasmic adaptor subunit [Acidithiobacillus sp. HP-6]|uniref:HlyD family type I secretion periplasmic adaptor subunit n=1 Tax=unclassified Acidithiobacillus TaxID=2614800 RepID=UPI00187954BF|nr:MULTISPECIES: HlyD family type I secretion periplasmic adaptor subunit [unclassified Acidithiobacillus]MBE7564016.1 HlyD family type I secretion periplasmic adaptor subunit [Acidithiobacillus sp. HP-6]MBE7569575.1 HlyD family type I secretion periplasmic adaptor subunit [Acidithiobacillus sp. HP-2]